MIQIHRPNADSFYLATGGVAALNPTDGVTRHYGNLLQGSTSSAIQDWILPRDCVLHRADVGIMILGTLGSTETFTAWVRVNDTTDTTISSSCTADAVINRFSNTNMNLSLSTGDGIQIKVTWPTWATNPTSVYVHSSLYFR